MAVRSSETIIVETEIEDERKKSESHRTGYPNKPTHQARKSKLILTAKDTSTWLNG